ncbi:gliding motility-associated C-terminal domain-containing protein [Hymenobacter sp. BT523]|uniref:T9SS type B sorting domain-containing protein n=1 Tax=Hymenobacter sp. BT523 TaxID=2795725 RepID=UPI0018EB8ACC|nr:gliding motility-associated C-terminal domain-containing protein [Hymenobacter sp. BT523]MBJ6110273.1 gliding motility-associated C-terminal domain-containing protein [Hymenobacter sp. BT523]
MQAFFLFRPGAGARLLLLLLLATAGMLARPEAARASHIRAGDIQAKVDTTAARNPRRIFFKMVLYTTENLSNPTSVVDENQVTIFFGDGTSSCYKGVDRVGGRRPLPGLSDTSYNIYLFEHTFPAAGQYTIKYVGENRVAGVLNMTASGNQSFYISTTIEIAPVYAANRTPILTAPAVDKAAVNQVFVHNPGAYDADGDSLVYTLQPSQKSTLLADAIVGPPCAGATGNNNPQVSDVPNFRYPNDPIITQPTVPYQVPYNGIPAGQLPNVPAIFEISNRRANPGQITWNAPVQAGTYNFAFRVEELRRTPLGWRKIGEVVRDMQIVVINTNNLRPILTLPPDLCVVAGQTVTGTVTAVDGSSSTSAAPTPIALFAFSGIRPPATFFQTQAGPPVASGVFTWRTDCSNVAQQPYLVVFKAQDTPPGAPTPTNQPLIDEQVWSIRVVGPPPRNVQAVASSTTGGLNSTTLTWDRYTCTNAANIYVYRKVGPGPAPGACETGIPASSGYVRIGTVSPGATTFTDDNAGRGLDRGLTYCYRLYADFPLPAGGASLASDEACVTFAGRAAQLKNVDVETTSATAGQIAVRWTQPRPATGASFAGTPSFVLSRGEGLNPATFVPVRTFTSLNDTSYVDTNLNTLDRQYSYRLEFVRSFPNGQPSITETSAPASSVRTTVLAANPPTAFTVSWTHNVPWDNSARPVRIFRKLTGSPTYVQVATAPTGLSGGTYTDSDPALVKGQTYCYYVQTEGRYTLTGFLSSLLNKSQEQCRPLIAPPCTPVLSLKATNCDSLAALPQSPGSQTYTNALRWTLGNTPAGCDAAVASYRVYYRPGTSGAFALIGTTSQTTFNHGNLPNSGGCYAVQAVAAGGAVSDTSNVACQENCLFFLLPNIFTPNGDGQNAVFRPKNNSPVRSVHFQAFNRWGRKVFENTTTADDPALINWDGGGPISGDVSGGKDGKTADGIYYYLAEVEFADVASTKRTYKGWVEIVR